MTVCKTCPTTICASDRRKGITRCRRCRKAQPKFRRQPSAQACECCPEVLTMSEVSRGLRRCRACRKARPGQVLAKRKTMTPEKAAFNRTPRRENISLGPGKSTVNDSHSWWLGLSPEAFTARAEEQVPRMRTNRVFHIATLGEANEARKRTRRAYEDAA